MDQTASLADALLKTPSLLGGLLSQMENGLGGNLASSGLFSNLLSQTDDLESTLAAMTQTPVAASPAASSSSLNVPSQTTTSDSLLQNLNDISSSLHQILAMLHQQSRNNSASSGNNGNSQNAASQQTGATGNNQNAATQTTTQTGNVSSNNTPAASSGATSSTDAVTQTNASDSTSDSDTMQTLAELLAELLMLTQLMIKNLQQMQAAASGGASTAQITAAATLNIGDAASANAGGATDSTNATPADPLLQLLTALEKTAQQLLPNASKDNTGNASSTAAAATPAVTTDIAQQLAALDAGLKNMLAALPKPNTANNAAVSDAAQASAAVVAGFAARALTTDTTGASQSGKNTATALQNQLSGTASTAAPTPAASNSNPAYTASAMMAAAAGNSDSTDADAGSDNLPGNNNASVPASVGATANAEGAQATGTYNFASQLSAFRAVNGGATGLPSVVDQVILQMNRNVKSGNDQMSLQLQPGDLGKITVKLDFGADGKVQGTVVADNPKTLEMLQKDSRSLERALQDAGLRADPGSLQFSLGGQSGQGNAGQTANNGAGNGGDATGEDGMALSDDLTLIDPSTLPETYYITPTGVNIQV